MDNSWTFSSVTGGGGGDSTCRVSLLSSLGVLKAESQVCVCVGGMGTYFPISEKK